MKKRFTEAQIAFALAAARGGQTGGGSLPGAGCDGCVVLHLEEEIWRDGLERAEAQLKALEDENKRLKRLVADLSLDKAMLQDVLSKKW